MSGEPVDEATLTRRTLILGTGGALVTATLAARLYYLQVLRAEDYASLSEQNRFNYNIVLPERGIVRDRHGVKLAVNKNDYRVVIIPERVESLDAALNSISDVVTISDKNRTRILRDAKRNPGFLPVVVDEHLTWDAFARLNLRTPELPGIVLDAGQGRNYPHGGLFSHTLGFVGTPGPKDVERDPDPLLRHPNFRIGKTGVEAVMDKTLRGEAGRLKVEVNARGRIVREWPNPDTRPKSGKDVWLTLDAELQAYAAELFEDDSGGIAVIDVMTGELRTLLSMPLFDGNLFVSGLTQEDMTRMNADYKRPQFNKVIGGGYPPASTFKMAVMLAALKSGLAKRTDKVYCTGKVRLGRRTFHCWKRQGHGPLDMRGGLKHSCDLYFYEMANRLGIDPIHDMAKILGFGQTFDMGVAGQNPGIVPNDAWKQRRLNDGWRKGDSYNAAIGQGFVLATPLQLAVMMARLANGRRAVTPNLIVSEEVAGFNSLDIDADDLQFVREAMWAVCQEPGGTAYRRNGIGIPGIDMAGKTGTGQVRSISLAERQSGVMSNARLQWELRDHSVFVGYAPYDQPRFAVGTLVEHAGSGAKRAAEISRRILQRALERDGLAAVTSDTKTSTL